MSKTGLLVLCAVFAVLNVYGGFLALSQGQAFWAVMNFVVAVLCLVGFLIS
jgi:hypothetical protein